MYDLDLFDTSVETIEQLHNDGRVVICYFSAGSWKESREDHLDFPEEVRGAPLAGWPGERWLDIRSSVVENLMKARMDLAVSKGCDGIDPDHVDGYTHKNGFGITEQDQIDYNLFLAEAAHSRELSVGLKNVPSLINELEPSFDFAINESCLVYEECPFMRPFLVANKAVFHVEYVDDSTQGEATLDTVCDEVSIKQFYTLIKTPSLDAWTLSCAERGS